MTDDQGKVAKDASGTPVEPGVTPTPIEQELKKALVMPLSAYRSTEPEKKPVPKAPEPPKPKPTPIDLSMKLPPLSSAPIPMMHSSEDDFAILPGPPTPLPSVPIAPTPPPKSYALKTSPPPTAPMPPKWQVSSAPANTTPPTHPEMQQDIARILQETKLPERRETRSGADATEIKSEPAMIQTRPTPLRRAPMSDLQKAAEAALPEEMRASMGRVRIVTPEPDELPGQAPLKPAESVAAMSADSSNPIAPPVVQTMPHTPGGPRAPQPDTSTAAAALMTTGAVPESPPQKIIPSLRTLKDDLQQLVRVKKVSLVHAATLEVERKQKSKEVSVAEIAVQRRRRARILRFLASVGALIFLGGAALIVVVLVQTERTAPQQQQFANGLMFSEQTLGFPLTEEGPRALKGRLASARSQFNLTLGAMLRVVPVLTVKDPETGQGSDRLASTKELFDALSPGTVPADLMRALSPDFFFAMHAVDENLPLLVVPVITYQSAFAGMLAWEKDMNENLSPLFTRVHYQKLDEKGAPILVRFEDLVIRNYDVRALKDRSGNIRMLYSFPSRNLLIIAESPHTFVEALARLRAERRL